MKAKVSVAPPPLKIRGYRHLIQRINLTLSLVLLAMGMILDFDLYQKALIGVTALLSFCAGVTRNDFVNYGINLLIGLIFLFGFIKFY